MKVKTVTTDKHTGIIPRLPLYVALAVGVAAALFWYFVHPEVMNYQEQYQLWLTDGDYLMESLKRCGGLVGYIGEFLVQFYYIEWLGAIVLGLVYGGLCWLVSKVIITVGSCRIKSKSKSHNQSENQPSGLPFFASLSGIAVALLLLWHMGDESVLMGYPVALIITLGIFLLVRKLSVWFDLLFIPALYWVAGPMAWMYALLRMNEDTDLPYPNKLKLRAIIGVPSLLVIPMYIYTMPQMPARAVMWGTEYYRMITDSPTLQFIIPLVIVVMAITVSVFSFSSFGKVSKTLYGILAAGVVVLGWMAVDRGYDADMHELMMQDRLIRNHRWNEVIERAERRTVPLNFWSESVNLSLAMTNQLAERQFDFYQSGSDALILSMMRDQTSDMPSMEAFYHLGMINEALRYAYDMQESIPYNKKSGRLSMRIAECYIINGNYVMARKYLRLLSRSLFYRKWAEEAMTYLGNEEKINSHKEWGLARQHRYKVDFLYYYPQMATLFANLFATDTSNKMALQYTIAQYMLNGDMEGFLGHIGWAEQYGGYADMPRAYRKAYECISAHGKLDLVTSSNSMDGYEEQGLH